MARFFRSAGKAASIAVASALFAAMTFAGCATTRHVQGVILEPALIPIRSYERIWIAAGDLPEERALANAVATDLHSVGQQNVRSLRINELEPLRASGRIPSGTVVVLLRLEFRESTRTRWFTRPETVCGPSGCFSTRRTVAYDVPALEGEATVTVYDGPTAAVQQQVVLRDGDHGRPFTAMRPRIIERLAQKVGLRTAETPRRVNIRVFRVDAEPVARALTEIEDGQWAEGRRSLERFVRSAAYRSLAAPDRARVLYNLGQARRFDPTTLHRGAAHFERARAALRRAVEIDPQHDFRRALIELRRHQHAHQLILEQRQQGREVAPSEGVLPAVPESYR